MSFVSALWQVILFKLQIKNFPVEDLYSGYLVGALAEDQICALLRSSQINSFIAFHDRVKACLNGTSSDRSFCTRLPHTLKDPQRTYFLLAKIDGLIERNLKENVRRPRVAEG